MTAAALVLALLTLGGVGAIALGDGARDTVGATLVFSAAGSLVAVALLAVALAG